MYSAEAAMEWASLALEWASYELGSDSDLAEEMRIAREEPERVRLFACHFFAAIAVPLDTRQNCIVSFA